MKYIFCPQCGKLLENREIGDEGLIKFCGNCNIPIFEHFGQCTLSVVINEYNEIALLKQDYVSKTNWILIAGYIKKGETLEESAIREVYEETGQKVVKIEYINSYFYNKKEIMMAGFKCNVIKKAFNNSKEVDKIKWFKIIEVENLLRDGSIGQKLFQSVKERIF